MTRVLSSSSIKHPRAWVVLGAAGAVGFLGIAFRSISFSSYSALPSEFSGPTAFREIYLLENREFLLDPITTYSYWSDGVNNQLGSYLMEVVGAAARMTGRFAGVPHEMVHQVLLTVGIGGVSVVLLFLVATRRVTAVQVALLTSLATLGTPVVIHYLTGWNVAYGILLLLIMTAVYVSDLSRRRKFLGLMVLTLLGPPLYHTYGFLAVIYAVALWVLGGIAHQRQGIPTPLLVLAAYLTYQGWISVQFFGELLTGLRDLVTLDFLGREPVTIASGNRGVDLRLVHLLIYGTLAALVSRATWTYVTTVLRRSTTVGEAGESGRRIRASTAAVSLAVAIGVFSLSLGVKFGADFLVNRAATFLIVPAVVAVALQLQAPRGRRVIVVALSAGVLALSTVSFSVQVPTVFAANHVSRDEAEAYEWLSDRLTDSDVVFTDFRLSGPFIADGHFRVVGITGRGSEPTEQLFRAIYAGKSGSEVSSGLDRLRTYHDNQPPNYAFISRLMTEPYPAINGYGSLFPPASPRFLSILEETDDWRVVFANPDVVVYRRGG